MKKLLILLTFVYLTGIAYGQIDSLSKNRFYIPKDIYECNQQLDKTLTKEAKDKLKYVKVDHLKRIYGIFIIGEWFDSDSTRLAIYFNKFCIQDWDDSEFLILKSYHSFLNNNPFDMINECKRIIAIKDSLKLLREIQYNINIVADSIDGVFIPTDIYSCCNELDKSLDNSIKRQIKRKKTEIELAEFHMSLGRWMRNNWGLWGGSRLQQYFQSKKLNHPDNMSAVILIAYNKHLNGKSIDIDAVINNVLIQEEEFKKNIVVSLIEYNPNDFYTDEYKEFLRTRQIKDFNISQ